MYMYIYRSHWARRRLVHRHRGARFAAAAAAWRPSPARLGEMVATSRAPAGRRGRTSVKDVCAVRLQVRPRRVSCTCTAQRMSVEDVCAVRLQVRPRRVSCTCTAQRMSVEDVCAVLLQVRPRRVSCRGGLSGGQGKILHARKEDANSREGLRGVVPGGNASGRLLSRRRAGSCKPRARARCTCALHVRAVNRTSCTCALPHGHIA
jgi:hypothetical protein